MMASKAIDSAPLPASGAFATGDRIGDWLAAARVAADPVEHVGTLLRAEIGRDRGDNPVWISKAAGTVLDGGRVLVGPHRALPNT